MKQQIRSGAIALICAAIGFMGAAIHKKAQPPRFIGSEMAAVPETIPRVPLQQRTTPQSTDSPQPEEIAFAAFDEWFKTFESSAANPSAELQKQGEFLAVERRDALARLIQSDPEEALKRAIPYEQRKKLPASIQRRLEDSINSDVRYEVIAGLGDPNQNASPSVHRYVTVNGRTLEAFVYGRRLSQPSKERTPVYGIAIGNSMAVAESPVRVLGAVEAADFALSRSAALCPVSERPADPGVAAQIGSKIEFFCHSGHIDTLSAALENAEHPNSSTAPHTATQAQSTERTKGIKSLLLIRAVFTDAPAESISVDGAQELIRKANEFFRASSYGEFSVIPTITPLLTLQYPAASYKTIAAGDPRFRVILEDARAVAAANGFDPADYDLDCVHLDGAIAGPRAYIGIKGATIYGNSPGTVCHELGHNLGLWHANVWLTSDRSVVGPGKDVEYQNPFDIMGRGGEELWDYNAYYKSLLGWLPASTIQTVASDGVYRLYPFDVPTLEAGSTYALRILRDDREYWVETRHRFGDINPKEIGQIALNWSPWSQSEGGTQLLDTTPDGYGGFYDAPLGVGQAFYDPALALKILPLRVVDAHSRAVDVLVQHLHYLATKPKAAAGENGFDLEIPAAGEYMVWVKPGSALGAAQLSIDGQAAAESAVVGTASSQWVRFADGTGRPLRLSFTAGYHFIRINPTPEEILVTDDDRQLLPPVMSNIPDQVVRLGAPLRIPLQTVVIGSSSSLLKIVVSSSNPALVPDANCQILEERDNPVLMINPIAQQLGQTTMTVSVTSPDGSWSTIAFNLAIIGEVQALVQEAAPGSTVVVPTGVFTDHLVINKDLTLEGSQDEETVIDANMNGIPVTITSNAIVNLKNLRIRNGRWGVKNMGVARLEGCTIDSNLSSGRGGGVWNVAAGSITIVNSTISSNRAFLQGGGLYNEGSARLINVTISGNRSSGSEGGGIYNVGECQAFNCTIVFNRAVRGGGFANSGVATIANTLVARNTCDKESEPDLRGRFASAGYNLVGSRPSTLLVDSDLTGLDPLLGPLQDNGGKTATHALLPGSPAIDAGQAFETLTDQRGIARGLHASGVASVRDGSDIGAFELVPQELAGNAPARLGVDRASNGRITLTVAGGNGSTWIIQGSTDLGTWETVAVTHEVPATIELPTPFKASAKVYRAIRY